MGEMGEMEVRGGGGGGGCWAFVPNVVGYVRLALSTTAFLTAFADPHLTLLFGALAGSLGK